LGLSTVPRRRWRAYDAAGWRFGHGREWLNFSRYYVSIGGRVPHSAAQPATREDRRRHEHAQLKLDIAKTNKRQMAEWRRLHPEDVAGENAFWSAKRAKRRDRRAEMRG
jgi:hypothetical protein